MEAPEPRFPHPWPWPVHSGAWLCDPGLLSPSHVFVSTSYICPYSEYQRFLQALTFSDSYHTHPWPTLNPHRGVLKRNPVGWAPRHQFGPEIRAGCF